MKNVKMQLDVVKGTSFFIATLDYDPKKQIEEELHWKSATPEILEFNAQTGEVCAVSAGCGTLYAEDESGAIRVFCVVNIEEAPVSATLTSKSTKATQTIKITSQSYRSSCHILTLGYTGKTFEYTPSGNRVTLGCGLLSKSGTQNNYSSAFETTIRFMDSIYRSLTPNERTAWLALKAAGFLLNVAGWLNPSPENIDKKLAQQILANAGIDLGTQIEVFLTGCYEWYAAEKNAEAYFNAF